MMLWEWGWGGAVVLVLLRTTLLCGRRPVTRTCPDTWISHHYLSTNLESQLTVKVVGTGFRIGLLVLLKLSASLDIDNVLCRGCKRPKEETISQSELLSDKHTQTHQPEKHVTWDDCAAKAQASRRLTLCWQRELKQNVLGTLPLAQGAVWFVKANHTRWRFCCIGIGWLKAFRSGHLQKK